MKASKTGEFQVARRSCKNCLFGPRKLVSEERKRQILDEEMTDGSHFTCHLASLEGRDVCCRAFYERGENLKVRLAKHLDEQSPGFVEFVDLKENGTKRT